MTDLKTWQTLVERGERTTQRAEASARAARTVDAGRGTPRAHDGIAGLSTAAKGEVRARTLFSIKPINKSFSSYGPALSEKCLF